MWKFAITSLLTILAVWVWQFLKWAWFKPKKIERLLRKQGMRGNSYRFLFGDANETKQMFEKASSKPIGIDDDIIPRVMPNILHYIQKYGNYSFSWSGPRPRIFITDTAVARDVLNKYRSYLKNFSASNEIIKLLVTGLANLEGDEWAKSRSRLNPFFNMDKLKPMVPTIQACTKDTLNEWTEMAAKNGGSFVVDVFHYLEVFTSAILAQLMFSLPFTQDIKETFSQLAELARLGHINAKIFSMPGEKYLPTKENRRAKEIGKYVRVSLSSIINERLKSNEGQQPSGSRDVLDILIGELYDGQTRKQSERNKIIEDTIAECRLFFFAGFETSSNLLTWAFVLLSTHQEWQTRAREEVLQVLGNRRDITADDLSKLKLVSNIINETLRLYSPVMEMSRVVNQETKINDYTIPKDTMLTFPVLMFHRDTKIWGEDAGEFRPDRFAEGVLKAANGDAAFMPFGWGPRICIGMNFALIESKIFLALFLREFSFELSPTYTHAPVVALTIQPQHGAPIVLKKL